MDRAAVFVVSLLVLAGCGSFASGGPNTTEQTQTTVDSPPVTTTPTTTPPTTEAEYPNVPITGDNLPVNEDRAFTRVQQLLDIDLLVPRVHVETVSPGNVSRGDFSEFRRPKRLLGVDWNRPSGSMVAGATYGPRSIRLRIAPNATKEQILRTLVHEYAHLQQYQNSVQRTDRLSYSVRAGDRFRSAGAVIEGAATYVRHAYAQRFLNRSDGISKWSYEEWQSLPAWRQFQVAHYHFGSQYVAARIDDPSNVTRVYQDPPRTSEQVLHPGSSPELPALNTSIAAEDWTATDRLRMGEMYIRILLGVSLSSDRAASAAAGWGNDSLVTFARNGTETGYAWTLRWEDAANASEFDAAIREHLSEISARTNTGWRNGTTRYRVEKLSDRTIVLTFGPEAFVRAANVTAKSTKHISAGPVNASV